MTLHKTLPSRERILLMGSYGTGKSTTWGTIADWLGNGGSRMFVYDTDFSAERVLEGFRDATNVEVRNPSTWDEHLRDVRYFRSKATRDDWLAVDLVGKVWEAAQAGFSERAFGKSVDEWFLEAAKAGTMGAIAGDFGVNWGVINRMYGSWFNELLRFPGHVIACAGVDPLQQPDDRKKIVGDSVDTRNMFGRFGVKPVGQKALGHQFLTVILTQHDGRNWVMNTVKDVGKREYLKGKVIGDFVTDYLIPVAGWRP